MSGAAAASAAVASTTAGSGRYATLTRSAASRAWSVVSATTNATGSPTWRTRSRANARRGGTMIGATVATWAMHGSAPMPSAIEIGGGEDATHPGHRAGGRGIDAFDHGMSVRRAQHDAVQLTGQSHVVDIAPLPGQKPAVFETAQRTPDMAPRHALAHPPAPAVGRPLTRGRRRPRRGGRNSSWSHAVIRLPSPEALSVADHSMAKPP